MFGDQNSSYFDKFITFINCIKAYIIATPFVQTWKRVANKNQVSRRLTHIAQQVTLCLWDSRLAATMHRFVTRLCSHAASVMDRGQWLKFTFPGGVRGGKASKISDKTFKFPTNSPFALEKVVFSPLLGQNFRKFVNCQRQTGRYGSRTRTEARKTVGRPWWITEMKTDSKSDPQSQGWMAIAPPKPHKSTFSLAQNSRDIIYSDKIAEN